MHTSPNNKVLTVAGPCLAVLFCWVTSSVGDDADERVALANVALVLAVLTVTLALLSASAGATTSIIAALALNWFHTAPVHTFRMQSSDDLTSVLLLALLGLGVSGVTAERVRRAALAGRATGALDARTDMATLNESAQPVHVLWHAAIAATSPGLAMVDAKVVEHVSPALPVIARPSRVSERGDSEFVLPPTGAAVPMQQGSLLVLSPRHGMGPLLLDRRAVWAFADTVHLAGNTP